MKLIAEQNEFVTMFNQMGMNGLFNPVILSVKKTIVTMVGCDVSYTTITSQKFKNIKIEDGDDGKIVFNTDEMINALKLFKSDDEITISTLENMIVITNSDTAEINDVITIPQIDITTINDLEFPFKIVNGLPVIKDKSTGEDIEFTISAELPVKYLAELVKRANYVGINPKIYKLEFDNNTLKGIVGMQSDFQKTVTTTVNIIGEGSGELLFGAGFEETVTTLSGNITIDGTPGAPCWITQKTDKNIVHMLIAPAIMIE